MKSTAEQSFVFIKMVIQYQAVTKTAGAVLVNFQTDRLSHKSIEGMGTCLSTKPVDFNQFFNF